MVPRCALLMVRGDWEWLCRCFRFRHFQNESFCYLCEATHTGANSYLNSAQDAPYRQTTLTHDRYELEQSSTEAPTESFRLHQHMIWPKPSITTQDLGCPRKATNMI